MLKDDLYNKIIWQNYFNHKTKNSTSIKDVDFINYYMQNEKYKEVIENFASNNFTFSIPTKKYINKVGNSKKRVIYIYPNDDLLIQGFISFYLHKYDNIFSDNCYAFKSCNIHNTIRHIFNNTDGLYAYKTDISDYFNSIDISILIDLLKENIHDNFLLSILINTLSDDYVIENNTIVKTLHGIFTGSPLSGFFANLYLDELDKMFDKTNIKYARYSDDIIVFGTKDEIINYKTIIKNVLEKYRLSINPKKEKLYEPNDTIDFLGFSYNNGIIDISEISKKKLFGKIKRKARYYRRLCIENNLPFQEGAKDFFNILNYKFYNTNSERNWSIWYFSTINTNKKLKEIDNYIVQYARYIFTGNFSKKNYNIKLNYLVSLGYKSLNSNYIFNKKLKKISP